MVESRLSWAIAIGAVLVYFWTPGAYNREHPLSSWTFNVPLPRQKLAKIMINDFETTAKHWVDNVRAVKRVREGYLVNTDAFDMVARRTKTGEWTWETSHKSSPLFVNKKERPSPAEIVKAPGIDWAVEWKLVELSPHVTQVQRTAFKFEQRSNSWLPMHRMIPLACQDEHRRIMKNLVEIAGV